MTSRKLLLALLVPALLSACANGLPGLRPKTFVTPGETRLFQRDNACPHSAGSDQSVPAVTAFAVVASKQALANFGTVLTKAAEGGDLSPTTGLRNVQVKRGVLPQCIVIVRGIWEPSGIAANGLPWDVVLSPFQGDKNELNNRIKALGLQPIINVHHVIELEVRNSIDGSAITFVPIFVKVEKSIDGATEGTRDLSISLQFGLPTNATPTGSVVMVPNREIGRAYLMTNPVYTAPWFTGPFAAPVGTSQSKATSDSPTNVDVATAKVTPMTITSRVVETRPTREALSFIAAVYGVVLPTLQEEAKNAIDTKSADAAKSTERSKEAKSLADAANALSDAQVALNAYCSSEADTPDQRGPKSSKARAAQFSANQAAIESGEPLPFDQIITVTSAPIAGWNLNICKKTR